MSRLSNLTDSNITKRIEQVSLGLLFIVLCFGLLPFLYLSVFTQPGAEDIAEALIKDIPWHIKYLYLSYDGRYFAALLYALNPVKQQLFFVYKLIPVALIAALMHASYKLFSALFTIEKKHYGICLSALFVLVYISGVPETSYSLYYMISSIVYTLPIIMSMYLIYFTLRLFSAESKRETWNILLISLLIFFIAGTNEEYLIPLCLYVFSIMLGNWYWKLGKKYEAILFSVVLSISLFLVFTSPGTSAFIENEEASSRNLSFHLDALRTSYSNTFPVLIQWLKSFSFLWFYALIISAFVAGKNIRLKHQISRKFFFLVSIIAFLFIPVLTLPYFWANGDRSVEFYPQVFHICLFSLIWILTIVAINIGHYLSTKSNTKIISQVILPLAIVALGFSVFKSVNIQTAYHDIRSGEAQAYDKALVEVFNQLNHPEIVNDKRVATICNLRHRPKTIFSGMFIDPYDDSWKLHYKMFFKLDDIKMIDCGQE